MFDHVDPRITQFLVMGLVGGSVLYLTVFGYRYLKHLHTVLLVLDRHAELVNKILRLTQIRQQPTLEDVKSRYETGGLYQVMDAMFLDCTRLHIPYRTVSRVLSEHCTQPEIEFRPYGNGIGIILPVGETRFEYTPSANPAV